MSENFSDYIASGQRYGINGVEHDGFYDKTTHRVRRVLFPEISIEDDIGDLNEKDNSIVASFLQPSQLLKNAILDLLSIKSQCDSSTNTISQIVSSLNGNDLNLVSKAIHDVYLLAREDKFIAQISNNDEIINALVKGTRSSDNNVKHDAIAGLSRISQKGPAVCYKIFRTGGIPELVRMLYNPVILIVHYAVTTLHNLLLYTEMAKDQIIGCGGIDALTALLAVQEGKLQAMVSDTLYLLMVDRPQSKVTFLNLHGPQHLINILKSSSYPKLLHAVIRCIRSLSTCQENKPVLVSLGVIELLHGVLNNTDAHKWRLAILTAIRNISDIATNLNTLSPLVVDLIRIANSSKDEDIVICACGILSNLTCNNNQNKQAICSSNGVPVLANILSRFINFEDITEPVLCTLRHCTVRHPLAFQAQNEIRFAHPIILDLLATRQPPIVKAALGLIRNCALSQINLESILAQSSNGENALSITVEILETTGTELRNDFTGSIDGVSLIEMIEGAISAMHQLAKDTSAAKYICTRPNLFSILADLLSYDQICNNDDELLMREIMGLIYQLSKIPEGIKMMLSFGLQKTITTSLNSVHKSIAAYAKIILRNVDAHTGNRHYATSNGGPPTQNIAMNGGGGVPFDVGWLNDGMEQELYNELYNYPPSLVEMNKNDNIVGGGHGSSWFDTDL